MNKGGLKNGQRETNQDQAKGSLKRWLPLARLGV